VDSGEVLLEVRVLGHGAHSEAGLYKRAWRSWECRFDFRGSNQFRDLIAREDEKYGAVIREASIQPN